LRTLNLNPVGPQHYRQLHTVILPEFGRMIVVQILRVPSRPVPNLVPGAVNRLGLRECLYIRSVDVSFNTKGRIPRRYVNLDSFKPVTRARTRIPPSKHCGLNLAFVRRSHPQNVSLSLLEQNYEPLQHIDSEKPPLSVEGHLYQSIDSEIVIIKSVDRLPTIQNQIVNEQRIVPRSVS
jgi:hypothetical protein